MAESTANSNNSAVYAAAISAGVDTMNMVSATKANKKGRQHAAEENQKNRDYATQMWHMQNEYNQRVTDPKYNMERLKNAGINPHLAYSNGTDLSTPTASALPNPTQGQQMPAPYHPRIDPTIVGNLALQKAQIDNINADTKNKEANTQNTSIIAGMNSQDLENKMNVINQENTIRGINIAQGEASVELTQSTVDKQRQEIINLISTNDSINQGISESINRMALNDAQKAQYIANLAVISATAKNINANTALTNEKTKTEATYRSNIEADTQNKGEQLRSMQRGNYYGEKYDGSNQESNMQINSADAKRAVQLFQNSQREGDILKEKVTTQQYQNDLMLLEMAGKSVEITKQVVNPLRKPTSTTTTRFDNQGEYQGHSTTRNHR